MKPIRFENGKLVDKAGEPVELDSDEQLIAISAGELETACEALHIGARDRKDRGNSIVNTAKLESSYSHKWRAAEREAEPILQQGTKMTELVEQLETLTQ